MSFTKRKRCGRCRKRKDHSEFYRNRSTKDGYQGYCKTCIKKWSNKWQKADPIRWRLYQWKRSIKKNYGLTPEKFDEILKSQNGKCAICRTKKPSTRMFHNRVFQVDHDHRTGMVRGLLCSSCNSVLAYARDNIEVLKSAIKYLDTARV